MINLNKQIQEQFDKMCATGKLFRSSITGQQIWNLYLESFEYDPIFRDPESSEHNCNLCNNFMRRYGNIVAIDENYQIMTIFDVDAPEEYAPSMKALSTLLRASKIANVFFETFSELNKLPYEVCKPTNTFFQLGMKANHKRYTKEEAKKFGVVKANEIRTFNHLNLTLPDVFVDKSGKSEAFLISEYRDAKEVFQRAMETITLDTFNLVKDLANQGSLLDAQSHLYKIEAMIPMKKAYDMIINKDNWCWVISYKLPFAKFRNELIGTLCSELAEGEELNKAVMSWNKRVDPINYMKTSAPVTEKMKQEAIKDFISLGYQETDLERRCATIDDIKASEILHLNIGTGEIKSASLFDSVKTSSNRHKRNEFDSVEEVSIEKFMTDILPSCTSVEAFLVNTQEKNMVSLLTAKHTENKDIFKWSNPYNWTFNGNLAGKSQIKEAVKTAGGAIDGVLRFSIMWSGDGIDNSDLDAHCIENSIRGDRKEIYYANKRSILSNGVLDIDITQPFNQMPKGAVENITYPDLDKMPDGIYKFFVNQFSSRNSKGFEAEIEFNNELFHYVYNKPVIGNIIIANVTLKDGVFSIEHILPCTTNDISSKEIYGLQSNEFHKVNLVCLSPNHWGDNNIGNKHYFFMLDKCKSPINIRSFHNENLATDLIKHRKFMDILGATLSVEPTKNGLSGIGFNATVHDELIVRLSGNFKRVIKIKF